MLRALTQTEVKEHKQREVKQRLRSPSRDLHHDSGPVSDGASQGSVPSPASLASHRQLWRSIPEVSWQMAFPL